VVLGWSKLNRPAKWSWSYLHVILDVFSRNPIGWTVQYRQNVQLATALIERATEQQQITPKVLTLHADRASPMRSKPLAFMLADLLLNELPTCWMVIRYGLAAVPDPFSDWLTGVRGPV
jgi:transposase InsO family protein